MSLENITIGLSPLTDHVYIGYMAKNGRMWNKKKDITDAFVNIVIQRWEGCSQIVTTQDTGDKFKISVQKL